MRVATPFACRGYTPSRGPLPRPLDGLPPALDERPALVLANAWLVAGGLAPEGRDLVGCPDAGPDAGQVCGSERGRLGDLRHDHRPPEDVGLELHEPAVPGRPAVRAKLGEPLAGGPLHRLDRVHGLIGDRLERRSGEVLPARAPGDPHDRAPSV